MLSGFGKKITIKFEINVMSTFEMQGLTWKARSKYQQDAFLMKRQPPKPTGANTLLPNTTLFR
ncbi:hypothetical protein VXE43_21535, partial [Acinetobacter baumannii]